MRQKKQKKHFNVVDVQKMAREMVNLFRRSFHKQGSEGAALGVFPVVGRGDGSLDDSYRLAQPGDSLRDYHTPLNSRQDPDGPFYVHTHPNQYERSGILFPDVSGHNQPGSHKAIYEREQLTMLTTELILRIAFELGHKPGLLLPPAKNRPRLTQPGANEGLLLKHLSQARENINESDLQANLEIMKSLSRNHQFAIVVSSFFSSQWEEKIIDIGRRMELIVFQIIDPSDLELPNIGQKRFSQGGKSSMLNTRSSKARHNYQQKASQRQAHIKQVLRQATSINGLSGHYELYTDKPLEEQLVRILVSRQPTSSRVA